MRMRFFNELLFEANAEQEKHPSWLHQVNSSLGRCIWGFLSQEIYSRRKICSRTEKPILEPVVAKIKCEK